MGPWRSWLRATAEMPPFLKITVAGKGDTRERGEPMQNRP
jgi:hypothetical protein